MVGPGTFLDSSKYFIIVIDSLANGVSSSPSNSKLQPRMQFPQITIHDMVVTGHTLLTKELHLDHVFAVAGMSMGGMQTFDWIVSYPTFMDKAVTIVGSPKLANYDRILWQTEIDAIKVDPAWMGGNYKTNPGVLAQARIGALTLSSPAFVESQYPGGQIPPAMLENAGSMDANDHIRQAEAMLALDVSKSTGGKLEDAAARVKAKVLVIIAKQDHTVTPQPALDFAKLLHAETMELDSPCGHIMLLCEMPTIGSAITRFLGQ
jgi:homoserine O-acetyltransferase